MKRNAIFLFCCILLSGVAGCKKIAGKVNEAAAFDIDYSNNIIVPSSSITITAPADFTTPDIPTGSADKFSSEKTGKDLVDEIKFTKFIISNPGGTFDFLKSISIYIKASGEADMLVASMSNIPPGRSSLAMDLTGANIKNHLFKDKIQFRVTVTIKTGLSGNQTIKMDETVRVSGKRIS